MKRITLWTCLGITAAATVVAAILILCTCAFGNHRYAAATCTEPEICTRCGRVRGTPLGHDCLPATCTEPEMCMRCGARRGTPLGHDFLPATCTEPEICARCGLSGEETLGHAFLPATCTEPETCFRCGLSRGEPLGHDYSPATCTEPEICTRCGCMYGEPLGHDFTEPTFQTRAKCLRCGEETGEPLPAALADRDLNLLSVGESVPYTTASYEDRDVDVTGMVEIADYRVIAGDGNFPAREGYEWHIATVRIVFAGEDARVNGAQSAWTYADYYLGECVVTAPDENGLRAFPVDWYGARVTCWQKTASAIESDWYDRELRFTWEEGVLVPEGYDGVLLIFFNSRLTEADADDALLNGAPAFRME